MASRSAGRSLRNCKSYASACDVGDGAAVGGYSCDPWRRGGFQVLAKTVVVADASRIKVGVRRNALIKVSEDARFDKDQVGFRLTMRVAGVSVAEASSVQIVKAAAS